MGGGTIEKDVRLGYDTRISFISALLRGDGSDRAIPGSSLSGQLFGRAGYVDICFVQISENIFHF
jgi:hypothetical protein